MSKLIRPLLATFAMLTVVTGVAYPALTTLIGQTAFSDKAAGSLIHKEGKVIGSSLIAQSFTEPQYVWGRPSATSPRPYDAANSAGSNQGPTNPALIDAIKGRMDALKATDPDNHAPIPVDLVTASGSGLDPDISPAAALYQADRVARVRKLPRAQVVSLIAANTQGRQFGILGEPRVNVLKLNLALDAAAPFTAPAKS
ncbi:potassium-transporting ATPase subunit KdpC [Burkholderiaceae bacterium DAT-1]|nr:potassium-transporting ATPase subunit KdpC [Burkholderiaceae bacterium DAT-1]